MKHNLTFLVVDVLLAVAYPILFVIQGVRRFLRVRRS
jgi:hypothetical protein